MGQESIGILLQLMNRSFKATNFQLIPKASDPEAFRPISLFRSFVELPFFKIPELHPNLFALKRKKKEKKKKKRGRKSNGTSDNITSLRSNIDHGIASLVLLDLGLADPVTVTSIHKKKKK